MKVVDYYLLGRNDYGSFTFEIQEKMKDGWQPLGGVAILQPLVSQASYMFFQAMVKYE